jgi:hypothetical protein
MSVAEVRVASRSKEPRLRVLQLTDLHLMDISKVYPAKPGFSDIIEIWTER